MRKSFSKFAVTASIALALAFTFSCSNSEDGDSSSSNSNTGVSSSGGNGSVASSSSIDGGGLSSSSDNGNTSSSSLAEQEPWVKACGDIMYDERLHFCLAGYNVIAPYCDDHILYDPQLYHCVGGVTVPINPSSSSSAEPWIKVCGYNTYDERTHFCSTGDVIATWCDDHTLYNSFEKFCSYVGNGTTFTSTPLPFCVDYNNKNKYNDGMWKWEYCVSLGTTQQGTTVHTVLRCSGQQMPDPNSSLTCKCIENASPATAGCQCNAGYTLVFVDGTPTCKQ